MNVSKFLFVGNLTRDTEVRYTGSNPYATIHIAVDQTWKDGSGARQKKTSFFRLTQFGPAAEHSGRYLGKGSEVYVEGRIESSAYEKDGETRWSTDFIVERIDYGKTKKPAGGEESDNESSDA
ncbi:Single-stranded DNA-binding protein [Ralstonia thomasii]|jgi:single-strand DNA-binding protein|uniref:single-stranded DNA-binding protein n=1 Tax=Ralstonia TaxID=48736 RepID=UPI000BD8BFA8|nr:MULTISPECIES: single-stranded DNA-binding protein [Ralstonia]MBT2180964.1 single-stranded DNA-binding protein [Ralstonia pickettii]POH90094.1 single-stranded DNA-binding protein [Ralstonia pickettii]CAJ0718490.1 Single-stranded DNA-binding protein [Ralstonia sp. LMG 18095]